MDLGVAVVDVITYATTTLTDFGAVIAAVLGIALAVGTIKKFVRTR